MNISEYHNGDSQRLGTVSQASAKFIQICASQDDLFALDAEGNIHQYNFNAKTWVKLVASRSQESPERSDPRNTRRRADESLLRR